jgi:hypothetical protein
MAQEIGPVLCLTLTSPAEKIAQHKKTDHMEQLVKEYRGNSHP